MSIQRDADKDREQREWDAQESAVRSERTGTRVGQGATVAQYRLIARALRNPPLDPLPSDFAARTAALIEPKVRAASEYVEVWLERALVTLLLLAGAAAIVVYNGEWLRERTFSLPEPAVFGIQNVASWAIAVGACIGVSWAFELARKR